MNHLNNCRLIFKLPCYTKILESLVKDQLKTVLSRASILSPLQPGFVAGHSTVTAVIVVFE